MPKFTPRGNPHDFFLKSHRSHAKTDKHALRVHIDDVEYVWVFTKRDRYRRFDTSKEEIFRSNELVTCLPSLHEKYLKRQKNDNTRKQ